MVRECDSAEALGPLGSLVSHSVPLGEGTGRTVDRGYPETGRSGLPWIRAGSRPKVDGPFPRGPSTDTLSNTGGESAGVPESAREETSTRKGPVRGPLG